MVEAAMASATSEQKVPAKSEAPVQKKDKKPYKMLESHLGEANTQKYVRMAATVPVGVKLEEALKPAFWSNVAHMFAPQFGNMDDRAGAIIELRSEDHSFYAELYVRAVLENSLVVSLVGEPVYFGPKDIKSANFEARWNVGTKSWEVRRLLDGAVVGKGLKTKEDAQKWIDDMGGSA